MKMINLQQHKIIQNSWKNLNRYFHLQNQVNHLKIYKELSYRHHNLLFYATKIKSNNSEAGFGFEKTLAMRLVPTSVWCVIMPAPNIPPNWLTKKDSRTYIYLFLKEFELVWSNCDFEVNIFFYSQIPFFWLEITKIKKVHVAFWLIVINDDEREKQIIAPVWRTWTTYPI